MYSLGWDQPDVPSGFAREMKLSSLARVETTLPPTSDRLIDQIDFGSTLRKQGLQSFSFTPEISGAKAITTRTENARWKFRYNWIDANWDSQQIIATPYEVYSSGQVSRRRDGFPVYGPVVSDAYPPGDAWRIGDQAVVFPGMFGDSAGNRGWFPNALTYSLTRVDKPGTVPVDQFGFYVMAAEPGVYRYDTTAKRRMGELSTEVTASWTFNSSRTAGPYGQALPLSTVRFAPTLTDTGDAPAGRLFAVPLVVQKAPGSPAGRMRRITVDVSYDDGATWTRAPVLFDLALLCHPDKAGYASLRASGADDQGNAVTVTIIHAYRLVKS
jgi:hypothetical protein